MKRIFFISLLVLPFLSLAQDQDEVSIRKILDKQIASWNKGDLEGFMQGYWHSDSLMFIGKSGISWGWKNTLDNYRKSYRDTAEMGKLSFQILVVKKLSPEYYYIVGKWALARSMGDLSGHYNLLLRKINGQWLIIADHSS